MKNKKFFILFLILIFLNPSLVDAQGACGATCNVNKVISDCPSAYWTGTTCCWSRYSCASNPFGVWQCLYNNINGNPPDCDPRCVTLSGTLTYQYNGGEV